MNTIDFVSYLQNLGVKFWVDGEQLRYRSPRGIITPELKKDIVERKAELLNLLREAQTIHQSVATSIQPISREQTIPLSYTQHRQWFVEKIGLMKNACNVPIFISIVGKLDYVALKKTINQIIARHELLRTTYSEINGTPVQIISPFFELQLPLVDLSELTGSEQTTKLAQLIRPEWTTTFNLELDFPIRAQLYQLGATEYRLLILRA